MLKVHTRRPPRVIVLDMDSSESPTYAASAGMNGRPGKMRQTTATEVRLDHGKAAGSGFARPSVSPFWLSAGRLRLNFVPTGLDETEDHARRIGNPRNVGLFLCHTRNVNEKVTDEHGASRVVRL
jgi:hypothetical protein